MEYSEGERLNIKYMDKENPFKGLTKEASFVPPKGVEVSAERTNPQYIQYLYVSEGPAASMFEVCPFIFDAINIAQYR